MPLKILLADRELQNEFASIIKPFFEKAAINEQQNQELVALRDWLLPMLMNGQVKVETDSPNLSQDTTTTSIAAEPEQAYKKKNKTKPLPTEGKDARYAQWLSAQGLAARGTVDTTTMRAIFDAMDDEDK